MRLGLVLSFLVCHMVALPAYAGAWLREQGTGFSSTSFSATYFRDIATSTYLEYGLRDNATIGADIGYLTSRLGVRSGYATLFLRKPLGRGDRPNKWSYELGVGAAWIGDLVLPHVKTGLSWGRGYKLRDKNGWMTVDASVTWDFNLGLHLTKVDATVGLTFTDQTAGMIQLYLGNLDGETYGSLAPSVVFKPKKGKFRIQFGAEAPLDDFDSTALKIGIWREF